MKRFLTGLSFLIATSSAFAGTPHTLSGADAESVSNIIGMKAFQIYCVGRDYQNECFASSDANNLEGSLKRIDNQPQTQTLWKMFHTAGYSNTISDVSGSAGDSVITAGDMNCTPASKNSAEVCTFSAE